MIVNDEGEERTFASADGDWHPLWERVAFNPESDDGSRRHRGRGAGGKGSRLLGNLATAVAATLVFAGAVAGVWFWMTVTAPVATPQIVGLTPTQASKALAAAGLADGRAYYLVTRQFPPGLVASQSPPPAASAPQKSPVDVQVSVEPTPVAVPDVGRIEAEVAEATLKTALLQPSVLYAYSKQVETGRVIEQLPRAGDTATTGSQDVLVVSLGPGTKGTDMPSLVGLDVRLARSVAASATLYASVRGVAASGAASGTVVDQVPAAGTIVPATTVVTISVATGSSSL